MLLYDVICIYYVYIQVKLLKSGPALTLHITRSRGVTIDVDLVPVVEFQAPKWPNSPVRQCSQVNYLNLTNL